MKVFKLEFLILLVIFMIAAGYQVINSFGMEDVLSNGTAALDELQVTYIGNMGVLIQTSNHSVLIDGFHKKYGRNYAFPSETTVERLMTGSFSKSGPLDIALSTHKHADHFDASYFVEFLHRNKNSIAVGPDQIYNLVIEQDEGISGRMKSIKYNGDVSQIDHSGIRIKGFRCDHSSPERHGAIQNVTYVIDIEGFVVAHLGDTDWTISQPIFSEKDINSLSIDLAIIPYWMLYEKNAANWLQEFIPARKYIATHISPLMTKGDKDVLEDEHPDVELFTELGEQVVLYNGK